MRRFALLAVLALTACAGDMGWNNPNLPKERASSDYASCRRASEAEVGGRYYEPPSDDRNSDPARLAEREDNRKRFNALVGACMRDKGYFPKP